MNSVVPSVELLNLVQAQFQGLEPLPSPYPRSFPEVQEVEETTPEIKSQPKPETSKVEKLSKPVEQQPELDKDVPPVQEPPVNFSPAPSVSLVTNYAGWEKEHKSIPTAQAPTAQAPTALKSQQPGAATSKEQPNKDGLYEIDMGEDDLEMETVSKAVHDTLDHADEKFKLNKTQSHHTDEVGDLDILEDSDETDTLGYESLEKMKKLKQCFDPNRHHVCLENYGDYIFQMSWFQINGDQDGYANWYKKLGKHAKLMIQTNTFLSHLEKGAKVSKANFSKATGMSEQAFEDLFNKISYYRLILQRVSPPSFVAMADTGSWETYYKILAELAHPSDNKQIKRNVMELAVSIKDTQLRNRTAAQMRQMLDTFYS